ncbi:MAG: glycosyltransferase family 2 protein [Kordiimonas sp.]
MSPIYGCRDCLEALVDATWAAFDKSNLDWELILVDDRGPDDPWPLICEIADKHPRVRGIRLSRNHGQHLAIWAGLKEARGDWVAVIDCDLQDDPAIIPDLWKQGVSEYTHAVLVDRGEWKDTGLRRLASNIFVRVMDLLSGVKLNNNVGNFGLYSRRMVETLLLFKDKEVFLPLMVSLTGLPQTMFKGQSRADRIAGQSSYNFRRLLRVAIAIVIRFSDRPLKLSVLLGITLSGFSVVFSLLLLAAWITGAFTVPGWTSLILSVWFLAGLILAVLGVHGFYIGRIFAEVQNRPRILIEERTPHENSTASSTPMDINL